jgi:hypothetical protein
LVADCDSSAEFNLLLACCANDANAANRIRSILSSALDWDRVLALTEHHRVTPQLYQRLAPISESIPPQHFQMLQSRHRENARRALWFTAELIRIVRHFEAAQIEVLPHKGPVLAQVLYGKVTEREFSDLDLLVHPADVGRAKAALLNLGYQLAVRFSPRQERNYIASGYEYAFRRVHGDTLLELQWRLLPRFYSVNFDLGGIFDRAENVTLSDWTLRSICREDLFLALCTHAAKHSWRQLSWLCDIARLSQDQALNWNVITAQARQLGIGRILVVNLLLARRLLGAVFPLASELQDRAAVSLTDQVAQVMATGNHHETDSVAYFRLMIKLRERWRDRARFLWRLALTSGPGEWKTIHLPDRLFPLYRFLRICRLAERLTRIIQDSRAFLRARFNPALSPPNTTRL